MRFLENFSFSKTDVLVSFDVTSLFTKVPIPETLKIVESRLEEIRQLESDPLSMVTSLTNRAIMELLGYVLADCYFTWDKTLYKQKAGVPMGGRLSPILATLYMENLEYSVLCSATKVPKLFFRYVDDIIIVWDESTGSYKEFLALLNDHHPSIQLTEERECNRTLPFLDMAITRPLFSDSEQLIEPLQINMYRKPTHSNRYLQFNSAHPLKQLENVVWGLWLRANRILKNFPGQLRAELKFLERSLTDERNGYPLPTIKKWFAKFTRQVRANPEILETNSRLTQEAVFVHSGQQRFELPTARFRFPDAEGDQSTVRNSASDTNGDQSTVRNSAPDANGDHSEVCISSETGQESEQEPPEESREGEEGQNVPEGIPREPILIIPYVPGISDQLKRISSQFGVTTWFTYPGGSMDRFTQYRGRLPKSKTRHAVYQCLCNCGAAYIGESARNLKVRVAEHLHSSSRSGFSDHLQNNQHRPAMKDTVVLAREKNGQKRKLIETIAIDHAQKKRTRTICNSGFSSDLPAIWQICSQHVEKQLRKYN